ncbi:hypothetical protein YC2023_045786 [Brassica napus]
MVEVFVNCQKLKDKVESTGKANQLVYLRSDLVVVYTTATTTEELLATMTKTMAETQSTAKAM